MPGSHIIRFAPGDYGGATLSHDLYLPIWKSDVSVSLMIDKKAKRCAVLLYITDGEKQLNGLCSALSVRFFGEDITVAGKKAKEQKEQKLEAKATATNSAGIATREGEHVDESAEAPDEFDAGDDNDDVRMRDGEQ